MLATSFVLHAILVAGMAGTSPQGRSHALESASGLDLPELIEEVRLPKGALLVLGISG